ncbi:MAG: N-acetyl-gamma-glutamyl-phosphate reductase [candidate division FCPU426 bacterium]
MIRIAIVGASGYTGAELVRLLSLHPEAKVVAATSDSFAGQKLGDLYPALGAAGDMVLRKLSDADLSPKSADVVFLAVPHGESLKLTPGLVASGAKVIDLSGDFRFHDTSVYEAWYKHPHTAKELAGQAVYGLPELFRDKIRGAKLIANPGCYVTSVVLSLFPLVKTGLVDCQHILVDAKSGVSGAGRKVQYETQFARVSENIIPYKVGVHQHTPEMEQSLKMAGGREVVITFSPHLVPARRGILSVAYARLLNHSTTAELTRLYQDFYRNEPFVEVRTAPSGLPELASAVGTNRCLVSVLADERTQTAIAVASLDNLIKGASGQAIQNLNLLAGLPESLGLTGPGLLP